jgi:broad specificity phosphatase PhoE|uniref:Phosphoglycerate mutase n=1 Tax=Phaeodactylum tricornutum TaxID=2850 RepID=A0A8J9SGX8_PHATR
MSTSPSTDTTAPESPTPTDPAPLTFRTNPRHPHNEPQHQQQYPQQYPLILYGLRHGTSVANEWMTGPNAWGASTFRDDVTLRDAPLSDAGRAQARQLANTLELSNAVPPPTSSLSPSCSRAELENVQLVVVSPLRRCLETYDAVSPRLRRNDGSPGPPVIVQPWAAERVFTVADQGTPGTALRNRYPDWDWSLVTDQPWWYDHHHDNNNSNNNNNNHQLDATPYVEWRPSQQGQWYAVPGEPENVFAARMRRLEQWLRARPERHILIVTHWAVLRHWTGQEIDNCGIGKIEWRRDESTDP